jgi:F-type H+-transporting ATPase subunit epsilon
MIIELVTPQRKLFSVDADSVTFTGQLGEMTVMPGHVPLITALRPGPLTLRSAGGQEVFAVGGGIAQIDGNRVALLAESAEAAGEIDAARASKARAQAELALKEQSYYDEAFAETQAAVARASTRLAVVGK